MSSSEFRNRALAEARRYGRDPWVFVRELAQNARDARATRLTITTGHDAFGDWVRFDDDGVGMSLAHARDYLFCLYASSKEDDPEAAGRFGVGFWSVLRFEPLAIRVESTTGQEAWAVKLDESLTEVSRPASEKGDLGTRVTLWRRVTATPWRTELAAALSRYCRFLTQLNSPARPLAMTLDGIPINEPMVLPGVSLSFVTRHAQGVVGLGPEPRVELHAHGLLVTTASFVEELLPGGRAAKSARHVGGLAPVVLLDSQRLDLVLSRQDAVQSRELERLVRLTRRRIKRLVRGVSHAARPLPWHRRFRDAWTSSRVRVWGAASLAMLAVAGGAGWSLSTGSAAQEPVATRVEQPENVGLSEIEMPSPAEVEPPVLPYRNVGQYTGATVEVPDSSVPAWGLTYDGPRELFFVALTLDRFDPEAGWMRRPLPVVGRYPPWRCQHDCVAVRLHVAQSAEPLVVPTPSGYRVDSASVRLEGEAFAEGLATNAVGEPLIVLPHGGLLTYTVGPAPAVARRLSVVDLPTQAPSAWQRLVIKVARLPVPTRVTRVTQFVRTTLQYDVSPSTAQSYLEAQGAWLNRVNSVGRGDCDVKNGVNAFLLNAAGVPARLCIGIAGQHGVARAQLHAWTEYYHQGWHAVDATGAPTAEPSTPALTPVAAPVVANAPQASAPAKPSSATPLEPTPSPNRRPAPGAALELSVPPQESWSSGRGSHGLLWAQGVGLVLMLGFGAWRWRHRTRETWQAVAGPRAAQQALAAMLTDALMNPQAWRHTATLWQQRTLPTLLGGAMSLSEAMQRLAAGGLYVSRAHSELALACAKGGTPVLDAADPVFAPVLVALGQGIDLDLLDALRPMDLTDAEPPMARVARCLGPLNELLRRAHVDVQCRVVRGLGQRPLTDIDLGDTRLSASAPWPRRYVALNAEHHDVRERLKLLASAEPAGLFVFLDWLIDQSVLLSGHASRLRERAALQALGKS